MEKRRYGAGNSSGARGVTAPFGHMGELHALTEVEEQLYFLVLENEGGPVQVWRSDGTRQGTILVKQLVSSEPAIDAGIGAVNGRFLFRTLLDGDHGRIATLWASDGTEGGTQVVGDVPVGLTALNVHGTMFLSLPDEHGRFLNGDVLWKTDGTKEGTQQVSDLLLKTPFKGRSTLASARGHPLLLRRRRLPWQ